MAASVSKYVPALDGIRGLAIIVVLIHHQLTPFSLDGGFLGVDLFFVLSGFLITSLLLSEHEKTNSISIKNFYMRRVLRLGPALFVYLIACLAVAAYTNSIELSRQLKLIGISLAYATNWRMAFGWDSVLDPTAIIWSLSIEEQFYLIWPLLLATLLTLKISRRYLAVGLSCVIVFVLLHRLSLYINGTDLTRLYYGSDTRADAIMVGCLAAVIPFKNLQTQSRRLLELMGVVAVTAYSALLLTVSFGDRFLYLGGFTLVAVISALIILSSTYSHSRVLTAVFSFSVLRWFGKISYGLYLWHWLVVRTTSFYYLGSFESWARLALAVGIAAASFYLIEMRFNRMKDRFSVHSRKHANEQTELSNSYILLRPIENQS